MKIIRVRAIARKEFLHIIRDPRSLIMGLAIPMLLILLFGYALTLDVEHVPMAVWDQDDSAASQDLLSRFKGSRYFSLQKNAGDYQSIEDGINSGDIRLALIIPPDFARSLAGQETAEVQIIVDGSDSNTATIAIGYAEAVLATYGADITASRSVPGGAPSSPLDFRARAWYNPDLQSRNFIIPGLIAVIMMVIAALMTSLTVAREWESGSMERLISTPVRAEEIIFGKLLPYFAMGLVDVALAALMGEFIFQVPLRGNAGLVFALAAIFLAGALGLGILISILTKSQLLASQLAMVLTFLPSFLLSGFMYAVSNMPEAIQVVTYLIPARYFVSLLKGIYLKGIGLNILWMEALLLAAFGLAVLSVARFKFRKRLQ